MKILQDFTSILLQVQLFFNVVSIFAKYLSTFLKRYVSCAVKIALLFSAATGAEHSAVSRHPHIGVLAGSLSKDQTGANLVVLGQDLLVGATTLSIQIL
jgi:hypothetical protein